MNICSLSCMTEYLTNLIDYLMNENEKEQLGKEAFVNLELCIFRR